MPPKARRDRNCGTGGGLKSPREDAAAVEDVESADYECATFVFGFRIEKLPNLGTMGKSPPKARLELLGANRAHPSPLPAPCSLCCLQLRLLLLLRLLRCVPILPKASMMLLLLLVKTMATATLLLWL